MTMLNFPKYEKRKDKPYPETNVGIAENEWGKIEKELSQKVDAELLKKIREIFGNALSGWHFHEKFYYGSSDVVCYLRKCIKMAESICKGTESDAMKLAYLNLLVADIIKNLDWEEKPKPKNEGYGIDIGDPFF